ncbi:MAG TPA: diguanylate cyclase, partial [Actinomycetota bacterium]|nr:diguanylate cyclase [Actinomycetota bacterium]
MGWQFPARRRAAGRERLLATAGAALLAAPDADAVHRVAAEATAELLGLDAPAELARDLDLVPEEARSALESLRAQVALALERADLAAEVTRRASIDPLTGLANRAAFARRLREALGTLDGPVPPGPALLLLDLDDFK